MAAGEAFLKALTIINDSLLVLNNQRSENVEVVGMGVGPCPLLVYNTAFSSYTEFAT